MKGTDRTLLIHNGGMWSVMRYRAGTWLTAHHEVDLDRVLVHMRRHQIAGECFLWRTGGGSGMAFCIGQGTVWKTQPFQSGPFEELAVAAIAYARML